MLRLAAQELQQTPAPGRFLRKIAAPNALSDHLRAALPIVAKISDTPRLRRGFAKGGGDESR
jgi:hypothetical protein